MLLFGGVRCFRCDLPHHEHIECWLLATRVSCCTSAQPFNLLLMPTFSSLDSVPSVFLCFFAFGVTQNETPGRESAADGCQCVARHWLPAQLTYYSPFCLLVSSIGGLFLGPVCVLHAHTFFVNVCLRGPPRWGCGLQGMMRVLGVQTDESLRVIAFPPVMPSD